MTSNHRKFYILLATLFFIAGITVLFYTGPGRAFLRGTMSDFLVVPFLYYLWAALYPTPRRIRAAGVLSLAFALEFFQLLELVDADSHILLQITLGTTFDPWDFVAYTVGLLIAVGIEGAWLYTKID